MLKIKLIIDTNLWVSYLINRLKGSLSCILLDERFEIITSKQLTGELAETFQDSDLRKYFQENTRQLFIKSFALATTEIHVTSDVKLCRDPKVDFLLSLAFDADADYIITGDKDLLVLISFNKTRIITLNEFQEIFKPG